MDKFSKRKSEEDEEIVAIREQRHRLKQHIDRQRQSREQLLNSLSSLVPDITSSLELTVKCLSAFDGFDLQRPLKNQKLLTLGSREANGVGNLKTEAALRALNGTRSEDERGAHEIVKGIVVSCLMSSNVTAPIDSAGVTRRLPKDLSLAERDAIAEVGAEGGVVAAVEAVLKTLADGPGAALEIEECVLGGKTRVMVLMMDKARLSKEFNGHFGAGKDGSPGAGPGPYSDVWPGSTDPHMQGPLAVPGPPMYPRMMGPRPRLSMMGMPGVPGMGMGFGGMPPFQRPPLGPGPLPGPGALTRGKSSDDDVMKDLEALLNKKSYRELQKSKTGEELLDLLHRPTAKETAVAAKFKTKGGSALKEYCPDLTKEDCRCHRGSYLACEKMHFRRIIALHTDVNLGDCSFLDTCRHMKTCKYVHYELDSTPDVPGMILGVPPPQTTISKRRAEYCSEVELGEPQWVNCDIRSFKMEILGQFGVIMADPPWDIHMELPYGTMSDDEMRSLNVPVLQTNGLIFLWVTGRAMELGRECLELWGYKRVEELIWVKTNQLQRIIRTGRTGHWLNHSKEHCLVGIKGSPEVNRNIDTDVIVAEVRETSRKPDEMYPMLERISPRTRKLELFARMHNTHAGWISLGNQLSGVRLVDEGLRSRFKAAYPDVEFQPPDPPPVKHASESEMTIPKSPPPPLGKDATAETMSTIPCEKAASEDKVVSRDAEAVA